MNLKSDKIAWFASWPDTEEKVKQILSNASLLRKNGWDVGLVTQYPNLRDVDFSVLDHVVYDNTNEMCFSESESFKYGFKRIIPSCSIMRQECGNLVYVDQKVRAPHLFSVMRLYSISMHMSVGYGYKVYAYFESDFWGTQMLCDAINIEADRIVTDDLNFVGFRSYNLKDAMNACLFLGNPKILSHHFPLHSVKSKDDFYRIYQNENVEDCLLRFFYQDAKSIIYPKDEVSRFLGQYGNDWDTSQAGMDWLDNVSERTLASFTTNAPFLRKTDSGYSLFYMFKQELISEYITFEAKLTLIGEVDEVIFEASRSLSYNHFFCWENILQIEVNSGKKIRVQTKCSFSDLLLSEDYLIDTDFQELAGYYRIRHIE